MDWAQILVIILSITLGIFLLTGIILLVMLIRVTLQIKRVTDSAQRTAESIERGVAQAKNAKTASFIVRKLITAVKAASAKRRGK
jgi:uncharacterized protein YoxC